VFRRTLILGVLIGAVGYGALVFLQWQMGIGDFAKGPQRLTLLKFDRRVVGGGRAGVEYFGREGPELSFRLHCLENQETVARPLRLETGELSEKTCGVYLRVLEVKNSDGFGVEIEVSWDRK
jgi:hypothetical protein